MSKIAAILELVRLLKPYTADIVALVKQVLDVIKQWKGEDDAKVGAASPHDVDNAVATLKSEGLTEDQAKELLNA